MLATESAAARQVSPLTARRWRVESTGRENRMGGRTSYELVPGDNVLPMALPGSSFRRRAGFLDHHLWVTPYRRDERYPAGEYPNQHQGATGCPAGRRTTVRSRARTWCSGTPSARTTCPGSRTGR